MFRENRQGIIFSSGARINICVTGYQHSAPPALGRNSPAKSGSVRDFDPRTLAPVGAAEISRWWSGAKPREPRREGVAPW
jgi:hypothetical protein